MTLQDLRAGIRLLPEAVLLLNGDGVVIAANAAAGILLEADPEQLEGRTFQTLVTDYAEADRFLQRVGGVRAFMPGGVSVRRGDAIRPVRADGGLVRRDPDGSRVLMVRLQERAEAVGEFRLLARRLDSLNRQLRHQRAEDELHRKLLAAEQNAREAAEQSSRLKDELLRALSHELRTPIHAALGWLARLEAGLPDGATADAREAVDGLRQALERETRLVEDLILTSDFVTGRVTMDIAAMNLGEVVDEVAEEFRSEVAARGLTLDVDGGAGLPQVRGDRTALRRVVWHLLSNAVKFTPEGGEIRLRVRAEPGRQLLEVVDSGTGVAEETLPLLFDRFQSGDGKTGTPRGGLGLGLALVKELVEAHGGSVSAMSPGPGLGTTVTVVLPTGAVEAAPVREKPRPPSSQAMRGLRVLVVEDYVDARDLLLLMFSAYGAEVVAVESAERALEVFEGQTFDVLVSDIGLPGMDGYALMRAVRARGDAAARIPAVALTAYTRPQDRAAAEDAGFQRHVGKPVEPGALLAVVSELVAEGRSASGA